MLWAVLGIALSACTTGKNSIKFGEWNSLFDGKTIKGWHTYGKPGTVGSAWKVQEGAITLDASSKDNWQVRGGGDIVTDQEYDNYELELEWKIANCGNSGIIYHIVESPENDYCWRTGPEMQVLDNKCHDDAKYPKHRAGDLYDLKSSTKETVKPAGEWNKVRIVSYNGKMQHWLNGELVVQYELGSEAFNEMLSQSKFSDKKEFPSFGKSQKGRIGLQDHGDQVSFKNIRIRKIF